MWQGATQTRAQRLFTGLPALCHVQPNLQQSQVGPSLYALPRVFAVLSAKTICSIFLTPVARCLFSLEVQPAIPLSAQGSASLSHHIFR